MLVVVALVFVVVMAAATHRHGCGNGCRCAIDGGFACDGALAAFCGFYVATIYSGFLSCGGIFRCCAVNRKGEGDLGDIERLEIAQCGQMGQYEALLASLQFANLGKQLKCLAICGEHNGLLVVAVGCF